jgi:arsenite methyltransferase
MSRDLMYQDEIREVVRGAYAAVSGGAGAAVAERLYGREALDGLPAGAVDWALGVGDPVGGAGLEPGETVLDLGCGGGIDTILAARAVGPGGRVIGVDLLDEMCGRARAFAAEAGVSATVELRPGAMEEIPLPDASVDVVVSNGVLNLSARKSRALAEIFRVLRPGGRISITDLTVDDELPPEVLTSESAWAG